ncbi:MAG TPA: SGNH/GDSL hydrolase family protein [Streptosporangiaceae bacterium]
MSASIAAALCGLLLNVQPARAEPQPANGIAAAGKADPAKRPDDVFTPGTKRPGARVLPGTNKKIAPLTSKLKTTAPKALAGAGKGTGLTFAGGSAGASASALDAFNCVPSIFGSTFVGNDADIGPYSDTSYTADVSCNFFLESMYGVSAAVDWSPHYEGEIGYVGTEFAGSGSYGASFGAFEVQGDQYDGGRAVEVILELYLQASAPWADCGPIPGLRYLACDGLGTFQLHVVVGTGPFGTGLAPPVIHWAALGDSYSAGTGASSYLGPPNPPDCRRSLQTYSYRVNGGSLPLGDRGERIALDQPDLKACDGAKTVDMYFTQNNRGAENRQLTYVTKRTRLVTLTIGGNDLDFGPILRTCIFSDCSGAPLIPPDKASTLQDTLVRLYRDIRGQMRRGGELVVLSYPAFLPNPADAAVDPLPSFTRCTAVNSQITVAELTRIYQAAAQLSNIISGAVAQLGDPSVKFVDVLDAFRGHRICSDAPWANGVDLLDVPETFHPNDRGYVEMASQLILQAGIGT